MSDLHLGTRSRRAVLEHPEARAALLASVREADRLILLGDTLELREAPVADVLDAARPVLRELGAAAAGRPVVLVPGNHDSQLVAALTERRRLDGMPTPVAEETRTAHAGLVSRVAEALRPAQVHVASPGLWLRPDVWATHGHYLDLHMSVPRPECLAAGLLGRLRGGIPLHDATPDHYEAALQPLYTVSYELAQYDAGAAGLVTGRLGGRVWAGLTAPAGRAGLRERALARVALPLGVRVANRAGLGPFSARVGTAELGRSGNAAMIEVLARLGLTPPWVVFGHTHRAGPWSEDLVEDWTTRAGTRLVNAGSWVHHAALVGGAGRASPYWPGTAVWVDPTGPPTPVRILGDTVGDGFSGSSPVSAPRATRTVRR